MKKLTILLIISLVFSTALHAQSATSEQTNFIKRQYNSFRDDVKLIHKCYLKKTPACSENERADAKKAAERVTKKGAALIAAIIGTAVVGYGVYVMRKYQKKEELLQIFELAINNMQQKVTTLISEYESNEKVTLSDNLKKAVQAYAKAYTIWKNISFLNLFRSVEFAKQRMEARAEGKSVFVNLTDDEYIIMDRFLYQLTIGDLPENISDSDVAKTIQEGYKAST